MQSQRLARRSGTVIAIVALLLVAAPVGLAAAKGKGGGGGGSGYYLSAPYPSVVVDGGTNCWIICGRNTLVVDSRSTVTGVVVLAAVSTADILQGEGIWAMRGFWSSTFQVSSTRSYNMNFNWVVTWHAEETSICLPAIGGSSATAKIYLYGNLADITGGGMSWVHNGDVWREIWDQTLSCPLVYWQGGGSNQNWLISFTGTLVAGHTYQFRSYLYVATAAAGLGIGSARGVADVGTASYGPQARAILTSLSAVPV